MKAAQALPPDFTKLSICTREDPIHFWLKWAKRGDVNVQRELSTYGSELEVGRAGGRQLALDKVAVGEVEVQLAIGSDRL